MATRSLGSLTLDLVAKIGGFTQGMNEAERVADRKSREIARKNQQRAKEVDKAWRDATRFIAGAFAGLSLAGLFTTFIRESVDAQNEQAQLAAALKSTGEAAGFSARQLNDMAAAMAGNSIFSEGDINKAQTRLLAYTGIVGEQFPAAMQAVIDMAARLGMSVEQSAETIGKALDIPSQGLTALQRQGFRFTEEQKKVVEELEKTGRVAEAQAIVLGALESAYGGAAQAARNTLGGSLLALQEQLRTLMTGEDGSLEGVREAVEDLIKLLGSPEAKAGFAAMVEGLASVTRATVGAILEVSRFGKFLGETLARQVSGSADPLERLDEQITTLTGNIERTQKRLASQPFFTQNTDFVKGLKTEVEEYQKQLDVARRARAQLATERTSVQASAAPTPGGGVRPPSPAEQRALAAAAAAREAAEKAAKAANKEAQTYLENLRKQLQATEELSVAETVLRDIQAGRVKLIGGVTQQQLLDIAKQIDLAKEMEKIEKEFKKLDEEAIERKKALADAAKAVYDDTRTPIERLNIELAALNKQLADGAISWDTWARASDAAQDKYEGSLKQGEKALSELDKFREKALEGLQEGISDTLYDAMQGNFDNIGKGFKQLIDKMVAEALAADIMRKLFGSPGYNGGSGAGGGGWLDAAFKWVGGLFGGGRAAGGVVMPNQMYRVNESSPEMLEMGGQNYLMMGNRAGRVTPGANAGNRAIVVQVTPPAGMNSETAYQYGRRIGAGIDVAMGRNS